MAVTTITVDTWSVDTLDALPATAAVASDGGTSAKYLATIDCTGIKGGLLIILENNDSENTEKATIWAGDNDFLAAGAKIEQTMAPSTKYYVFVDIAKHIQTSGTYKSKIVVEGASTDTKVAAVSFPYLP